MVKHNRGGQIELVNNGNFHVNHETFDDLMRIVTEDLPRPLGYHVSFLQFLRVGHFQYTLTAQNYNLLQENQIVTVMLEKGASLGALYESMHNRLSNLELRLGTATSGL